MQRPIVTHFFDEPTNTFSYVVQDPDSSACAIIDSVLDFDYAAGRTDIRSANQIIAFVRENGWKWLGYWKPMSTLTTSPQHRICMIS
ncbi:hypothetical protein HAALTHF_28340n [Vreelandella aquamarina]|nr:hypothetical protein HAALTHF_28340n [Halomonas axialensis]